MIFSKPCTQCTNKATTQTFLFVYIYIYLYIYDEFKDLLDPSSLGQINEPSPAQIVAGKDTPNLFMGEAFPKSLLVQLTQQVAEILKKDLYKKAELESSRSNEGPSK